MSASTTAAAGSNAGRIAIIGGVAALAVGIGIAAGTFLTTNRALPIGSGASYVPVDAPIYLEVRLDPSEAQDSSLRELLGRFPEIEGVDLDRPLYEQLGEVLDEAGADADALSWSEDIDSWFDGRVGLAILEVPAEAMAPTDMMAEPPVPSMVGLFGVDDRAEAEAAIGRLRDDAGEGMTFTEQVHAGVSIQVAEGGFAYALTDDQLIVAPVADDIVAAIDAHGSRESTLAAADSITSLTGALPADWLMFGIFDFTEVMATAFESAAAASPGAEAFRELFESQPLRGAFAMTADGDRVTVETASDPPTGALAVSNAERGLADEVPGDALYYAEGGNVGASLEAVIGPLKESLASMPEGEQQLRMVESALGRDVEELVAWIGDAATVAGYDGEQVWGGLVIVPTEMEEADDTLDQLATFASLASLDPSLGLTLEEREVEGATITSLRWSDPNAPSDPESMPPDAMPFAAPELVVEWTITDDRVLIGIGDRFVERVVGLGSGDSLAEVERYRDAVAEMGGASNAAVTWLDLRGVVAAVEGAMPPETDGMGAGMSEALEWVRPLDRLVSVSRLDGEVLVSSAALLVD